MKQVIIVNEALTLPRGKLAAQVAHAAVDAFLSASPALRKRWLEQGMPKIVLKADTEAELLQLEKAARKAGLSVALIQDAGRTVVAAGTVTCLGIGPAEAEAIDAITGQLKLLK
jgi:PTH2 family peptidyl-tRNA hydrolase